MDIGETLYRNRRVDYTYLHPEVLTQRCLISGNKLVLNNQENRKEYRVLSVTDGNTISLASALKIGDFYENGGTVIATSKLPFLSAEANHDKEVQQAIGGIFGVAPAELISGRIPYLAKSNRAGGKAYYLPQAEANLLKTTLAESIPIRDVDIREAAWPQTSGRDYAGALTYLHKIKEGRDIYFFANSTERKVDTDVVLRGAQKLVLWNPHTGERKAVRAEQSSVRGMAVTTMRLSLLPFKSTFYVTESPE
jgi:hypothetical protein